MTENTLRRAGCTTVQSVIERALRRRLPRFGPRGRDEVKAALTRNSIPVPVHSGERASALREITQNLRTLHRDLDVEVKRWRRVLREVSERLSELE